MKRILLLIFPLFILSNIQAAILQPVKWTFEQNNISEKESELIFRASIEKPWHMYGTQMPADGPVPTSIQFNTIKGAELVGEIQKKSPLVKEFDVTFGMELSWYEKEAVFVQKIKITDVDNYSINGYVEAMACDNTQCLPPTKAEFSFGKTIASTTENTEKSLTEFSKYWTPVIEELRSFGEGSTTTKGVSLWFIFFAGLIGGFLALLTPCVWPIIPMTMSFFLKHSKDKKHGQRNAALFGGAIIVIYVTLGILITLIFGAGALNALSTNAVFNLFFFALLIVFAVSFFGYFEITLPASWSTKLNEKAESTSGILSILLMAFVLVVVSFSCTGPIIGTLLVEVAVNGSFLAPAIGMLGFAVALSIPFTLFAMFPSWLKSMPKSGGWLNTVKVVLAFLELALALKFLSVADMAYGWGILPRYLFIAVWVLIFALLGIYLLGLIRFPHDSKLKKLSVFRLAFALISFAFAGYLAQGFWGHPLKAVSAFAPPQVSAFEEFHDFDEGMEYAAQNNLPVLVDFSGYGCVNCRKMEASVFTQPEVKRLMEKYVLIVLYVDDRTKCAQPFEIEENGRRQTIHTKGDRWSYLQRSKFGANAQPFFVLLNNDGKPINTSFAFTENAAEFAVFLTTGLKNYQK